MYIYIYINIYILDVPSPDNVHVAGAEGRLAAAEVIYILLLASRA